MENQVNNKISPEKRLAATLGLMVEIPLLLKKVVNGLYLVYYEITETLSFIFDMTHCNQISPKHNKSVILQ